VRALCIAVAIAMIALPALATPKHKITASKPSNAKPPPAKGFWKILVTPRQKWVLKDTIAESVHEAPVILTVEPVGIHQVGSATVAHLNWTLDDGNDHRALAGTHAGLLNQVAVTDAGLYLLPDDADDARITEILKGKPSRSDPPKPYKPTKLNEGRFLTIDGDIVCMGQGPAPGDPECEDTCEGQVCISATDGVVILDGTWTPGVTHFAADKYR
jgi:hypothetical protein